MELNDDINTEEQLRGRQNDEFKALKECFADQLVDLRKLVKVSRNPKKRKRDRLWIPIELSVRIESRPEPIAEFDLHIKCTRKYPLLPPAIGFKNVKGIGRTLISKLHKQLKYEAANEEHRGQGCIALLIMRAQQFLEDHYRDLELNNKSFYDQMVEQRQTCDRKAEMSRKHQDELNKLERERQVEEIRQKILRKRELYNESKKRRDSQSSNLENDIDESTYNYEGDLDGSESINTSVTDDGEINNTNRIDELDEFAEDEETVIKATTARSKRAHFGSQQKSSTRSASGNEHDTNNYTQSRVDLEYEVIEELGHGGFGTVYKVRNKVDSRLYALKKVKLNPDNETLNEKIMREVKLLSRLNHENVIRYYTAWNEIETKEYNSLRIDSSAATGEDSSARDSKILSQRNLSSSSDDEADDVYHTSYLINDRNVEKVGAGEMTENYVVFETSGDRDENDIVESMKKALGPRLSDCESDNELSQLDKSSSGLRTKTNRWLYIQMELGQGTLREAIDQGLPKQKDRARRFFREILDGLCHIHRQGIIHRDLKPVNIFLDSMDRPKIGDFGLATTNLFIVTQSSGYGVPTAKAIKPNRMSLEKLRLLASPEAGDSPGGSADGTMNKSGERLRYIQNNQTDNIGTPLYMSPELSATNEKTRIAKVVYSHKVDVYSLGIIYFEMLYTFQTGHERIIILQDLRKKEIKMPEDVESHLSREDIELIRLLLTHDVAQRPTSEKLSTSNLLPSVGLKERECQNIIKQVVQNRQARTHKHMLRLLFEQNDSYVDDFVFDYEDTDYSIANNHLSSFAGGSSSSSVFEAQNLLKDFNTTTLVLDQVKMKLQCLLRSRGFVNFAAPILMPKYSATKYYSKLQLEDVVMLMDKNSSILTLPYDLRLPFARTIARTNINYMSRFAIERIFRQRQILGYHPDQLLECCVDIVTPEAQAQVADAEILNLIGDVIKTLPVLTTLKPVIKLNHIKLIRTIIRMLNIANNNEEQLNSLMNCIVESLSVSLKQGAKFYSAIANQTPPTGTSGGGAVTLGQQHSSSIPFQVREDLKRDILASKLITNVNLISILVSFLDLVGETPQELAKSIEQQFNAKGLRTTKQLDEIKQVLRDLEETVCYAQALGLDLPTRISAGFVLGTLKSIDFYSGIICLVESKRSNKIRSKTQSLKSVILAVGGRYDKLIEQFSRNKSEVFDRMHNSNEPHNIDPRGEILRPKVAVGISFEVEKLARFALEDYMDKVNNLEQSPTASINQLIQLNTNSFMQPQSLLVASPSCGGATGFPSQQLSIRYWPIDIVICSLAVPRPKSLACVIASFVRQLRERGLKCNEIVPHESSSSFALDKLAAHSIENRIPYVITIKSSLASTQWQEKEEGNLFQAADFVSATQNSQQDSAAATSTSNPSSPSRLPIPSPTSSAGCLAILYQLDRSRLKELKRCDIPTMLEHLVKK